ncbi:MAG: geranylgeranyl reductase family protein [Desulfobacula sp.]|nr:geranylgeranyl reductase family protein [Desulfobacula sp.]
MFDVAIIGAGPAGTAAAFDLLTAGASVLIIDKVAFPRKKACAGGITPKGIQLFQYDISSVIRRVCRSVKIRKTNKQSFLIQSDNILCYMTKREDLDAFSLNEVIKKGGQFKIAKKIHQIHETSTGVQIVTDIGSFKASYLIGADGANSRVRRMVIKKRMWQQQWALEADVLVDHPEQYKMEFDFSGKHKGYHWIFPKGDHVNIGIYSIETRKKLRTQQLFEYANHRFGTQMGTQSLRAIKGYPICTGRYSFENKRILFAGDAAGLAERLLGEGIYFAIKSGQDAAKAILEASKNRLESAGIIYHRKLKTMQRDLSIYNLGAHWFYRFPNLSLKMVSSSFFHWRFARGYAAGKTISRILFK